MWLVRLFQCRYEKYNWQGLSQLPSLKAKAQRSVQQLLPYSWDSYQWMTFRWGRGLAAGEPVFGTCASLTSCPQPGVPPSPLA